MDEEPRPGVHNIEVNTAQLWANVTWSGGVGGGGGGVETSPMSGYRGAARGLKSWPCLG